jgi:hypothetical protein
VHRDHWAPGSTLQVETPEGPRDAHVRETFWI